MRTDDHYDTQLFLRTLDVHAIILRTLNVHTIILRTLNVHTIILHTLNVHAIILHTLNVHAIILHTLNVHTIIVNGSPHVQRVLQCNYQATDSSRNNCHHKSVDTENCHSLGHM